MSFIGAHRERWGVEPICAALQVAPSTYYAAVSRRPSARCQRDEQLKIEIRRVHRDNYGVYGIEKVWHQLTREGKKVGRDRVHRLMREMDLEGVVRGKRKPITTWPAELDTRPADLVERNFTAAAPNRLWVADLTYVSTWAGLRVCGVRHRRLQQMYRRLARVELFAHGPGAGCTRDGDLAAPASASGPHRVDSP